MPYSEAGHSGNIEEYILASLSTTYHIVRLAILVISGVHPGQPQYYIPYSEAGHGYI